MIGKISGIVDTINADSVLVNVVGVGYIINVSENTKNTLPIKGQNVSLYTEMLVREDSIQLIGFSSLLEKEWFRLLTSVQGVGAKAALAILGTVTLQQLLRSITLGESDYITSAPGIGPKIAKRILLELGQKVLNLGPDEERTFSEKDSAVEEKNIEGNNDGSTYNYLRSELTDDKGASAISALVNLGYDKLTSTRVVAKVCSENEESTISEIIRLSLQRIAGE